MNITTLGHALQYVGVSMVIGSVTGMVFMCKRTQNMITQLLEFKQKHEKNHGIEQCTDNVVAFEKRDNSIK